MTNYNESSTMNHTEALEDEMYQKITDICFKNGVATKPMVDKLYTLMTIQIDKAYRAGYLDGETEALVDVR